MTPISPVDKTPSGRRNEAPRERAHPKKLYFALIYALYRLNDLNIIGG